MKKLFIVIMILMCSVCYAEEGVLELEDGSVLEPYIEYRGYVIDSDAVFSDYSTTITIVKKREDSTSISYNDDGVVFDINGTELIRATEDGKFYINGELTKRNSKIYEAFLKWFEYLQKGA